jgi:hypothetical protein
MRSGGQPAGDPLDVWVTGSNQPLLARNVPELLAGRATYFDNRLALWRQADDRAIMVLTPRNQRHSPLGTTLAYEVDSQLLGNLAAAVGLAALPGRRPKQPRASCPPTPPFPLL